MEDKVIFLQRTDMPDEMRCWTWCSGSKAARQLKFARKRCAELNRGYSHRPWKVVVHPK